MSKTTDYKQLNQELEVILDKMQSADLDIDEAIKQYERGIAVVEELQGYLKQAENKVTKLKRTFESK